MDPKELAIMGRSSGKTRTIENLVLQEVKRMETEEVNMKLGDIHSITITKKPRNYISIWPTRMVSETKHDYHIKDEYIVQDLKEAISHVIFLYDMNPTLDKDAK